MDLFARPGNRRGFFRYAPPSNVRGAWPPALPLVGVLVPMRDNRKTRTSAEIQEHYEVPNP
jgi:hypothetical protein